ncbi:MAG: citryl-CoA lyase [Rhodospirillaceae bacterium]|nr:citryl-CoA lyase [Rhodospirillaceae bacterium]MBT6405140.1 citryl-CoA lyase [Rhodospirillaceae bacterium]MBT6535938.1 citryl-CoA lyase [Rhodospirillaceae bacterium]MBT7362543.1 citryl-CoA lyase [Rhodospirillaceae bacterium]
MLIGKKGEAKTAIETADATSITVRGKDLCNEVMGHSSIAEFFFLHLTGREPSADQAFFMDVLVVALAEHGLTPSVQAARMTLAAAPEAMQGAVAAGLLGVGSVILGSADVCGEMLDDAATRIEGGESPEAAALAIAREYKDAGKFIPGFGHPIHHPVDPRAVRILDLADERGVSARHVGALRAFPDAVAEVWGKPLPMNLQGPMAAVLLDLDFPKAAIRGIPILARTVGLIGHLNEEMERPIGFLLAHHGEEAITYDGD